MPAPARAKLAILLTFGRAPEFELGVDSGEERGISRGGAIELGASAIGAVEGEGMEGGGGATEPVAGVGAGPGARDGAPSSSSSTRT